MVPGYPEFVRLLFEPSAAPLLGMVESFLQVRQLSEAWYAKWRGWLLTFTQLLAPLLGMVEPFLWELVTVNVVEYIERNLV